MTRFQDSKIYKIVSSAGVYYGSTYCTLSRRLAKHVGNYKAWVADNTKGYNSSYKVLASPPYRIVLVKKYPCANREELCKEEQKYIDENPCMNMIKAYCSEEGYKDYRKIRYEENKEELKTKRRQKEYAKKNTIQCHCGGSCNRGKSSNRKKHYKTLRHKQYVSSIYGGYHLLQSHKAILPISVEDN